MENKQEAPKFIKTLDKHNKLTKRLREEVIEYLLYAVKKYGAIDFLEIDEDCNLCVSYDGGKHPEYESNLFSRVYSISLNKDNILCLDIEETPEYPIKYFSTSDLTEVAETIYSYEVGGYLEKETNNEN